MKFTKQIAVSALIAATLTFTGCTENQEKLAVAGVAVAGVTAIAASQSHKDGSHTDNYYHHGEDYGQNRDYGYQRGVRQGCNSRRGSWRKDNERYRHDQSYRNGWNAGFSRCK